MSKNTVPTSTRRNRRRIAFVAARFVAFCGIVYALGTVARIAFS